MTTVNNINSKQQDYITLDDFVPIAHVKRETIIKRYKDIPGVEKMQDGFRVLKGTRYPFPSGRFNITNAEDRYYVLLRALDEYRYIDSAMLGIYEESFKQMLSKLLAAGLIENNTTGNPFGANSYDITLRGRETIKKKKAETIKGILHAISNALGSFAGSAAASFTQ